MLALKTENGFVRTGTFFEFCVKDGRIGFRPLSADGKYLVGKGVLLGTSGVQGMGSMGKKEAKGEISCPVSKLCTAFKKGRGVFYVVYREVSTDLRADMPIAFLKIARITNALEQMHETLGKCAKQLLFKKRLGSLSGRNILLDGTIVDYADLVRGCKNKVSAEVTEELRTILFTAAIVSVAGDDALSALIKGEKETSGLVNARSGEILAKYNHLLKCFTKGAGDAAGYFRKLDA